MRFFLPARTRYLVLAVAAAVLAGLFVHIYLGGLDRRVPVVVAARDLAAYATLGPGTVKTILLPPAAVHPSSLAATSDALGKVTLVPRAAGEQIIGSSLAGGDDPGEYRVSLGPEERALFLPSEVVAGGWLAVERGDYIDLTVVLDGISHCLGQGLEVLDIVSEAPASIVGGRRELPAGILLRATPAVSEQIVLAMECGTVYYSIHGYSGLPAPSPGAWVEQLYGEGGIEDEVFWP